MHIFYCNVKGIHHYLALHRLCMENMGSSPGCNFLINSVSLYFFGMILFTQMSSTTYQKITASFWATFSAIYSFLKSRQFCVFAIASQPRFVLCAHAPLKFLYTTIFHFFCTNLVRRYSQLPGKPKFGQINCK